MTLAFSTFIPISKTSFRPDVSIQSTPFNATIPYQSVKRKPSTPVAVTTPPTSDKISAIDPSSTNQKSFDDVVMSTYSRYPITISHGQGATLTATDGQQYIDCAAGIATCTLGHAHPSIIQAVSEQVKKVTHVSNLYYIPEQGALATWLVNHSPADRVFFCNSGGEANEAAIKLARKYWYLKNSDSNQIPIILTAKQSFHGRTLATLTATGQPKYHQYWAPLVQGFDYVTYNDEQDLKILVNKYQHQLAAIMLEAVQGEGGIRPATKSFFKTARQLCNQHDVLLMCDEVQCGVGRTGKLWGFEHTDVEPDVFTTAKGLGGGVPIGAMLCKKSCDVFQPGDHASTFGGNPLASAAGLSIADQLIDGGVLHNSQQRGKQLYDGLVSLKDKMGSHIKEIRGYGLMLGVELNTLAAAEVVNRAIENGLLLVPAGKHVVRFVPPLIITEKQIDQVLKIFENTLRQI